MAKGDKRAAAKEFAQNWKGRGYEKGDAQVFWGELLRNVVGLDRISQRCKFEYRTSSGGFIDCLIPDSGVLVEQKAIGVDLDKPEERQGRMVTPFEQALAYAEDFPQGQQPRFIVVCNFGLFRVHDRTKHTRSELAKNYLEFTLEELGKNPHLLDFISNPENSRAEREKDVSITAGERVGQLFGMLREQYIDPDSPESQHALNVLCVRLVFCLFCEDADLFAKDALLNFLRKVEPESIRRELRDLFKALDTPVDRRDPYDDRFKGFPYVNGGLFAGEVEIPNFTEDMKHALLFDISRETDWSQISPTIFGGIFESTLNPETRHAGGMHYTSPENIHKVIDPLFLDGLREEFDSIRFDEGLTPKRRKSALRKFHEKISSLTFFDPACGSGNFLTETYLCLRELEDDVLNDLNEGQVSIDFDFDFESGKDEDALVNTKRVSLDQFFGIEINDFAVSVANTALWIAQLQANRRSEMIFSADIDDFPLKDHAHIREGNALRTDWTEVLPAARCDYVMGNPPFLGARNQSKEQKAEILDAFHGAKNCGNVDYVAGWYIRAAEYMDAASAQGRGTGRSGERIRTAFVSTNSICQGEQVANIWKSIFDLGYRIDFAHDTFRWVNEASGQAHVFCVIVGFSSGSGSSSRAKVLYHHAGPDADAERQEVGNLNAYLADAPDAFVWNRSKPLCSVPKIGIGSQPIDGGNYLFTGDEKRDFVVKEPLSEKYFHPFLGSAEFINGKERWCLWLGDITPSDLKQMPLSKERIEAVREFRLSSKRAQTNKAAATPNHFGTEIIAKSNSVLIPKVSSERRRYIPMGFVGPDTFCSDLVFLIPDATLYHFGILHSQMHNAWMRIVCGRLKSDYRYSGGVVYNNFPWPNAAPETLDVPVRDLVDEGIAARIEQCARAVLDARNLYPDSTLADMYDPDNDFLFPELIKAHKSLDAAVEAAYGVSFNGNEEKIVAHLFNLYAELTQG